MQSKTQVTTLKRRFAALRRRYNKLLAEQQQLVYRNTLLEGVSDSFILLQLQACTLSCASSEQRSREGLHQEALESLLQGAAVEQFPHQQQQQESREWDSIQDSVNRASPRNDPLGLFKSLVARLPETDPSRLTVADLAATYRETVLTANVHLAQHHAMSSAEDRADPTSILSETWFSYWSQCICVLCLGRPEYIAQVSLYNFSELQPDAKGAMQTTERLKLLPPVLGLSEQQVQDISVGNAVFEGLLQKVLDKQREVQETSCSSNVNAGDNASAMSLSTLSATLDAVQEANERLHELLHKEYVLRAAGVAFVLGCLSWEQITKTAAACWPFPVAVPLLAKEIAKRYQPQQQQQEEKEEEPQEELQQPQQSQR